MGKRLKGELLGKWSLRIGAYRIIYIINEEDKTIILLTVRPREKVYK